MLPFRVIIALGNIHILLMVVIFILFQSWIIEVALTSSHKTTRLSALIKVYLVYIPVSWSIQHDVVRHQTRQHTLTRNFLSAIQWNHILSLFFFFRDVSYNCSYSCRPYWRVIFIQKPSLIIINLKSLFIVANVSRFCVLFNLNSANLVHVILLVKLFFGVGVHWQIQHFISYFK